MARQKINAGSQLSVPVTATATASAAAALTSGSNIQGRLPVGSVVQVTHQQFSSFASSSSPNLPVDDTIPQNTEGFELMTLSITPTSASNYLLITATVFVSHSSSNGGVGVAMFRDSGADAIAAGIANIPVANYPSIVTIVARVLAGSQSPTTFKIRGGTNDGNTFYFNGRAGARLFGGSAGSSITIQEISA